MQRRLSDPVSSAPFQKLVLSREVQRRLVEPTVRTLHSHGRQPLDDLLVELDAQAGAIGHLQVAVLDNQRIL